MPKRIFDSNRLIKQFRLLRPYAGKNPADAKRCAGELIEAFGTDAIVSPVEIEFLAGIVDPHEMDLAEAFLQRFRIIDERRTPPEDWLEARRIAKHVVRNSGRRDLGDCLILAIAHRLHYDVSSSDGGLTRQQGRTQQHRS